jgi:hypothetical protein
METIFEILNPMRGLLGVILIAGSCYALWRVIKAMWDERKQNHIKACPMWIQTQGMGINGPDRKWGLKP